MLNKIKSALDEIEYTEDFAKFLTSVGIDENHDDYNDLMCTFMFGGKDPNVVADEIHQKVSLTVDFDEPKNYQPGMDFEADFQA